MKITRQGSFANTAVVGNVTYRMVGTYGVTIMVGLSLFMTPLFRWNIPAIIAYIAFASIVVGQTPTHRTILTNFYGILFKKPVKTVVSDLSTLNTLGHGIKVITFEDDLEVPVIKMYNNQYALVYNVTSGLTQWSTESDYQEQALRVKTLFNTLEGGESLMIVTKSDADTGMLQLETALSEMEDYEGDDLKKLSEQRRQNLINVATRDAGRSVQQYAILKVKAKNVNRCLKALKKSCRIIRPASNPVDIILAAEGLEAGAEQRDK